MNKPHVSPGLRLIRALFAAVIVAVALPSQSAAQEGDTRVFEIRTYTAVEGQLPKVIDRFRTGSMALLAEYGMEPIGYWVPKDAERSENTLIYILAHPSQEEAMAHWQAFFQDDRWKAMVAHYEADGPILSKVERVFVDPTDFSPLQ